MFVLVETCNTFFQLTNGNNKDRESILTSLDTFASLLRVWLREEREKRERERLIDSL